jgi:ABC-2 type transport system ATP-binding protein
MTLLHIQHWSLAFGKQQILDQLDFEMSHGEVVAILGSNGAGKSTLLKSILGFSDADAQYTGNIMLAGHNVFGQALEARRYIAYVPEQPAVYAHFSAIENLRYFLGLAGLDKPQAALEASLAQVNLPAQAWHQPCGTYSKGMRQKVMLALALAKNARLLLLDEPSSGLDPKATEDLSQLILQCKALEMGVLVVTHDVLSALAFSDRLLMLSQGKLKPIALSKESLNLNELQQLYLSA